MAQRADRASSTLEDGLAAPPQETTPLLQNADNAATRSNQDTLSGLHIFALCWSRAVETWIFFSIFPFMPALVRTTGVPEEQLGYYCGLIESSSAATQFCAMLFWSRWSDAYGRKGVLCCCLAGLSATALCFGVATTVWQMVLLRALGGIFSACSLTVRVMVSESTTHANSAYAYSYLTTATQIAVFLAPLAGGSLYDPASWLGAPFFFERYPAFLSASVNACFSAGALIVVILYVKETKPTHALSENGRSTYRSVLTAAGVLPVLTLFAWNWTFGGVGAILPVFYYTSIKLGGWSFSTASISVYMAGVGIIGTFWSLFLFPRMHSRYGTKTMLTCGGLLQIGTFGWPVLSNWLLRHNQTLAFWSVTPVFLIIRAITGPTAGVCLQLAMNSVAPAGAVGMVNGLALSLAAAQGAFTPAAATALFAVSIERQLLAGYLAWVVLIAWAVAYNLFLRLHAGKLKGKA